MTEAVAQPSTQTSWRIGVDVGGTFTDMILAGSDGRILVAKVASVPGDPAQGVLRALDKAAGMLATTTGELLARCGLFVHGSTVATNTVLEGKGAKVGMLTTEGFRDSIEIRRGHRDDPWDHRRPYPPVLVPRYLRQSVRGRLDRGGAEIAPLVPEDVDRALALFAEHGVESVAICLFNAYADGRHERAVAERAAGPGAMNWVSASSLVAPIVGEYERGSTTVLNAYVAPRTVGYLRRLAASLRERGLAGPMLLIQNNGGAVTVDRIVDRPASLLLSGPAAGVGALAHYAARIGSNDLISMEIGGTSCDVILMSRGDVAFADRLEIGGHVCVLPSVEVHPIGAGGGTIARVDGAGMLQVGPQGAGARPGPACYGLGGQDATITDAQVVLGRLKPGTYAGGEVAIDAPRAHEAVARKIAIPHGITVEAAASGIVRLMEQKLLQAVQRLSSERGHDPRRFTLVAAGGAGPMHGAAVGRALGCARVYLPRLSGAFCALGMLHADVRHDEVRVHFADLDRIADADLDGIFAGLERDMLSTLGKEGFVGASVRCERALDLRYLGQQWDITVPVGRSLDPAAIRGDFDREHDRQFGHTQPDGVIEITKLRITGLGILPPPATHRLADATGAPTPGERRPVWIDERHGWQDTAIYDGARLGPGHRIVGPAVIDEVTTTVLIGAGDVLEVDHAGNYAVSLAEASR